MYQIIMLRLSKDRVIPLICNTMQASEVMDFVRLSKEKSPDEILEQIEINFDCREVDYEEEDPFGLKEPENKSSQKFIVYISYNNGSEPSLFGYPTLEHAYIVGNKFITENGTVKIYEKNDDILWGNLKLIDTLKYKE